MTTEEKSETKPNDRLVTSLAQVRKMKKSVLLDYAIGCRDHLESCINDIDTLGKEIDEKDRKLADQERKIKELERDLRRTESRAKMNARSLNRTKDSVEYHRMNAEEMRRHRIELKRDLARAHETVKSLGEAHIAAINTQIASGLRSDARDPEFVKITDAREHRLNRELEQKRDMYLRKGHCPDEVIGKIFIVGGTDGGVWDGIKFGPHPDFPDEGHRLDALRYATNGGPFKRDPWG